MWKWLAGSTDKSCTDPQQAAALTHISRLPGNKNLQYPSELIKTFSYLKLLILHAYSQIFGGF
jgi:hypothetical protein